MKNTPPDSTSGSGKAESTQSPSQGSTAGVPVETAQVDASKISFQRTNVSPEWKQIEGFDTQEASDYSIAEDGQGVMHLFFNSHLKVYHCFQKADGSWPELRQIVEESMNWLGYWVGTTPDGSLYFAWNEHVSVPFGWTHVLRISLFKDGQWLEDPKAYDFKGAEGIKSLSISWFSAAFDTQGEPHFFYLGEGDMEEPSEAGKMPRMVSGLFLDGQQLTQSGIVDEKSVSVVQGVGDLAYKLQPKPSENDAFFYIGSGNVYHLMGYDQTSLVPGNWYPQYSRYLHSYSRDGGKTWEGHFTVFDGEYPIDRISIVGDIKGNLMLMACPGPDETVFTVSTFKPGSLETGTREWYLGNKQMDDYTQGLEYEEWLEFSSMYFSAMLLDSDTKPAPSAIIRVCSTSTALVKNAIK